MGSHEEVVEISSLERGLLSECRSDLEPESDDEPVLFAASFQEMEDNFVKYHTAQWVLYSLLLILAWGIGLLMLLYLPVRKYILRKDFQSKRLYLTPNSIVYKVICGLQSNILIELWHFSSVIKSSPLVIECVRIVLIFS